MSKGKRKKGPKHQTPHRNKYRVKFVTGDVSYQHSKQRSANYYGRR